MKNKINKIQIIRHIIQIISLFLSPGLFILAFEEFKNIYEMIIKGNFNFIQAFPSLVEFATVIFITIIFGRFFCGWICAFGAFNDLLHIISKNVFKINFKVNQKVDAALKYVKYLILLLIIVVAWTMGSKIFESASPWDAFAQITDLSQVLSNYTIGLILLVLISIGAFFVERFFCRYLCPLGALFTILSKISIFKIKKPNDKCGKCTLCTNNCSMGLPLYKVNSVSSGDCINCLKCVETCPRKNTAANILGKNINPTLAASVAIAAFAGVYALNNLSGTVLLKNDLASTTNISVSSSTSENYKDGTYTGTGTGFKGGTTKVAVTIKSNKITNIQTVSNEDTPKFYERVEDVILNEIISAQSTSVDTVSGATFSSRGIIDATQDALKQAAVGSSTSSNSSNTSENSDTKNTDDNTANKNTSNIDDNVTNKSASTKDTNNDATSKNSDTLNSNDTTTSSTSTTSSKYKDGAYTGTAAGFKRGTTKIAVTIKNDKITSIETISNEDTPRFYERVKDVIPNEIISAQSTSVDTVSGATFSSRGIINAVQDALSQAGL